MRKLAEVSDTAQTYLLHRYDDRMSHANASISIATDRMGAGCRVRSVGYDMVYAICRLRQDCWLRQDCRLRQVAYDDQWPVSYAIHRIRIRLCHYDGQHVYIPNLTAYFSLSLLSGKVFGMSPSCTL
jgi:hypothetical protein